MYISVDEQTLIGDEFSGGPLCQSLDIDEHGHTEEPENLRKPCSNVDPKFIALADVDKTPNCHIQYRRAGLQASLFLWEDLVSPDALLTARMLLRSSPLHFVELWVGNYTAHKTHQEIFPLYAAEKFLEMCLNSGSLESKRFFQSERDINELPLGSPLSLVLSMWCMDKCHLDTEVIDPIFDRFDYGNHIRYIELKEQGGFCVEQPGASLRDAGVGWFASSAGLPISTMPDQEYATWTAKAYRQCIQEQTPKLHRLSVDIQWSPQSMVKRDYLRLTIPFEDADGNRRLFCAMSDIEF